MSTHFKLNSEHILEYFSASATRMVSILKRAFKFISLWFAHTF